MVAAECRSFATEVSFYRNSGTAEAGSAAVAERVLKRRGAGAAKFLVHGPAHASCFEVLLFALLRVYTTSERVRSSRVVGEAWKFEICTCLRRAPTGLAAYSKTLLYPRPLISLLIFEK